nr:hypothetical protein [Candidatus Hydrogenedentota bacterium]
PHPHGLAGIYADVKAAFWAAIQAGNTPGLRTEGTGTTSADCPLTAVGNVEYNGSNPPKYLDGFFDTVEIRDAAGNWQPVQDGGAVALGGDQPLVARLGMTNLGEAAWLPPTEAGDAGAVYVRVDAVTTDWGPSSRIAPGIYPGESRFPIPVRVDRFGQSVLEEVTLMSDFPPLARLTLEFRFEAEGRAVFGPRYTVEVHSYPLADEIVRGEIP